MQENHRTRLYIFLISLAVFRLWIMAMPASLWLDETVTYWSVYKGVGAAIVRCQFWPGQNALFMALSAAVLRAAGHSEIALRLPSLLAGIATLYLVWRLGTELVDNETGLLAASVFVSLHELWRTVPTARPYAFALLVSLGSILHLVRWMDRGKNLNAVWFALLTALIPYFHYVFVICYAVLAIYAVYRLRTGSPVSWAKVAAVSGVILLLLSPLAWNAVYGKHVTPDSLSVWTGTPGLEDLITAFMPAVLAAGIFLGILAGCFLREPTSDDQAPTIKPANKILLLAWIAAPIVAVFLISKFTSFKSFVPRYYMLAFPALALLIGWMVRSLPPKMRVAVSASIVLTALLSFTGLHVWVAPHAEDWRAAARAIQTAQLPKDTPVLVRVGLVETSKVTWDLNISADSPLLCPLSKYPVPGRVFLLPYLPNAEAIPYLDELVTKVVEPSAEFVVMARDDKPDVLRWLTQESVRRGFEASPLGSPSGITVLLFRRSARIMDQRSIAKR